MSDANRTGLAFVKEAAWGTTPSSVLQTLRLTGESLDYPVETTASNELRADRNTSDLVTVGFAASGGFDFELSCTTFDALMEGALCSTWATDVLKNGVTETSFTVERAHSDLTQFFAFTGMEVDTFSITASAGAILTGSFGFQGKDCAIDTSTVGSSTATAATTTAVLNAMNNVGTIKEGGSVMSGVFISELSFNVANNLRALKAIGSTGAADMGMGEFSCSGSLSVYFANTDLYTKFLAGTASSLEFTATDAAGNAYKFEFPNVKFSSDKINAGGKNGDVMEQLGWTALYDSSAGASMVIPRTVA